MSKLKPSEQNLTIHLSSPVHVQWLSVDVHTKPLRIYNAGIFDDAKLTCTYECLVLSRELIRELSHRKAADVASVSPAVVDSLWQMANARNVSTGISLRRPIYL